MKYYKLCDDLEGRWAIGHFEFNEGDNVWTFTKAGTKDALRYVPKAWIREHGRRVNITYGDFDVLIVDNYAKDCFSPQEALFFPIEIADRPDRSVNYYIMKILHEVECVDLELSEYDLWEVNNPIRPDKAGSFKAIYKLVVDTSRDIEWNIFRIKRFNIEIVVSEMLKEKLEKKSITGVKFKEV